MKNYLIIGGGIAGVSLAHQIEICGFSFDLLDDNPAYNSSKVAAGFWNPIVFKRLTMSYKADVLIPKLELFYNSVSKKIDSHLINLKPQLKIFTSKNERHRFIDKAIVSEVSNFLNENIIEEIDGISAPYGLGKVLGTGYIDTVKYITDSISYFKTIDSFTEIKIEYEELNFQTGSLEFRGKAYEKVVFCEGYKAVNNPFFPNIKLKPTKGELLIIEIPKLIQDFAYAKSAGLIPIGNNKFIVGSTYDWEDLSEKTTNAAKKKLIYNLEDFLDFEYTVLDHQAGIRPSSFDRRPIVGQSHQHKNVYLLNGFGTKGIMYAPYYSEMLMNKIENSIEIDEEVDYRRC